VCIAGVLSAQTLKLTGTVVDAKTGEKVKGASVCLTKDIPFNTSGSPYYGELITLSNEGGHFAFGTSVGITNSVPGVVSSKPVIRKNRVHISITDAAQVHIALYSVSGRKIGTVLNRKMSEGKHMIAIFDMLPADQVTILRVSIDRQVFAYKHIPLLQNTTPVHELEKLTQSTTRAIVDTLFIIANGYWSKRVFIESYEGELGKIKLDPIELECTGCGKEPPHVGSYKDYTITVNGEERIYGSYVPNGYDKDKKVALFIGLHGMGALSQEDWESIWHESLEPTFGNNAVFLYPQARRGGGIYDLVWQVHAHRGNYEFIDEVVKKALEDFCIEETDIYLIGFSFGAKMAHGVRCLRGGSLFKAIIPASDVNGQSFNCPHHFDCTLCDCETARVPVFISAAKQDVGGGTEYKHAFYHLDTLLNYYDCPDEYQTINKESWGGNLFEYRLYNKGNCADYPIMVSINDADHWFEPPQGIALKEYVVLMISKGILPGKE
jgi:predicted esterase